jgi:ribonuclease BN (tRNA processing enzyme)
MAQLSAEQLQSAEQQRINRAIEKAAAAAIRELDKGVKFSNCGNDHQMAVAMSICDWITTATILAYSGDVRKAQGLLAMHGQSVAFRLNQALTRSPNQAEH